MDYLLRLVRDNPSVVSAIATVVSGLAAVIIAVATVVGAFIIRLEGKRQKADRMPILALREEQPVDSQQNQLHVKNIGYGPALNIVRKIAQTQLIVGSLGPGDKIFGLYHLGRNVGILDDPKFRVVLECDDVLGRHWEFSYEDRNLHGPKRISKRKMPPSEANRS